MSSYIRGIALVAALAFVAGCGSSDKKDDGTAAYKTAYKAESARIKKLGVDLAAAIQSASKKTDDQIVAQFQALATRAHVEASNLGNLNPPAKFQADNAALQTALSRAATDLDEIVKAARKHSYNDAKTATETLVGDSPIVKSTRDKLDAATK